MYFIVVLNVNELLKYQLPRLRHGKLTTQTKEQTANTEGKYIQFVLLNSYFTRVTLQFHNEYH